MFAELIIGRRWRFFWGGGCWKRPATAANSGACAFGRTSRGGQLRTEQAQTRRSPPAAKCCRRFLRSAVNPTIRRGFRESFRRSAAACHALSLPHCVDVNPHHAAAAAAAVLPGNNFQGEEQIKKKKKNKQIVSGVNYLNCFSCPSRKTFGLIRSSILLT